MKNLYTILLSTGLFLLCSSCDKLKDDPSVLGGDQSPIGDVGATLESSSVEIFGVSDFSASVIALKSGISSCSGQVTLKNEILKSLVANIPGVTINENIVTVSNLELKLSIEGIELKTGPSAGIWVKYSSSVGDTYPIGTTGEVRKVVSKSDTDDYPYGFMMIKTIQVEETPKVLKSAGVIKITYIANHKFGLVGVKINFDDGTSVIFPLYSSGQNG
ncbi:MAG: hypothetical protein WCR72_03575 [Bacteroidota bacterium]